LNNSQNQKRTDAGKDNELQQTKEFKPANHDQIVSEPIQDVNSIVSNLVKEDPAITGTANLQQSQSVPKSKQQSCSAAQTKNGVIKNSNQLTRDAGSLRKSAELGAVANVEDSVLQNNASNSNSSVTASTGEDPNAKLKTEEKQKSSRKNVQQKNKDEQSAKAGSEKSESEGKEPSKEKKVNKKKKEKICLTWMKQLEKLEALCKIDSNKTYLDDEAPDYCSNNSCPISEQKISESAKVAGLLKKVRFRKASFQDQDDRWY
jgi:hypothetical protein